MRRFYKELNKTFDGRTSHISGVELFAIGPYRIGWFVYRLFDRNSTTKQIQLIVKD